MVRKSLEKKNGKYTVSVCMTVYGTSPYLDEQILSIVNQSLPPDELIIFEDAGGTESPENKVMSILAETNIDLIYKKSDINVGPAEGFRKSVLESSGEVILFCDHDDIWCESKVEVLVRKIGSADALYHNAEVLGCDNSFKSGDKLYSYLDSKRGFLKLFFKNHIVGATLCGRGDIFRMLAKKYKFSPMHDWSIVVLLNLMNKETKYIDDVLMYYRRHDMTVTGRASNGIKSRIIKLANAVKYRVNLFSLCIRFYLL